MNATKKVLKKNEKEKDQQAALTNGGFKFYFCIQPKRYLVLFSIFALVIMPVVLLLLPHRRSYHFLLIATFRVIYNKTRSQTEHTYTHKLVERQKEKHQKNTQETEKENKCKFLPLRWAIWFRCYRWWLPPICCLPPRPAVKKKT